MNECVDPVLYFKDAFTSITRGPPCAFWHYKVFAIKTIFKDKQILHTNTALVDVKIRFGQV